MQVYNKNFSEYADREAGEHVSTENKVLKQCRLNSINAVTSSMTEFPIYRFLWTSFKSDSNMEIFHGHGLSHFAGQLMMLSVFFAGAGACKGIIDGKTLGEILPFYLMSFLGLYLYFSVSGLVDVHGKKAALKTSLTDYLENHMAARLSLLDESEWLAGAEVRSVSAGGAILREMESIGEEQDKIQAEAEQTTVKQSAGKLIAAELKEKIRPERVETMEKSPAETQMEEQIFTKNQEKELEELLKEFFA